MKDARKPDSPGPGDGKLRPSNGTYIPSKTIDFPQKYKLVTAYSLDEETDYKYNQLNENLFLFEYKTY